MHHARGVTRDSRTWLIKLARSLARRSTLVTWSARDSQSTEVCKSSSAVSYGLDRIIFHPRPGSEKKNSGEDERKREGERKRKRERDKWKREEKRNSAISCSRRYFRFGGIAEALVLWIIFPLRCLPSKLHSNVTRYIYNAGDNPAKKGTD